MNHKICYLGFACVLFIVLLPALMTGTDQSQSLVKEVLRVRIDEDILQKPDVQAAWRIYAENKKAWREELFFKQNPDEKKYRCTFKEELDCRRKLAEFWIEYKKSVPSSRDGYLDDLIKAYKSSYFPEYIFKYFRSSSWKMNKDRFRIDEFDKWAKEHIKGHAPQTMAHLEEIKL